MLFLGHHCHELSCVPTAYLFLWVEGTKGLSECLRGKESVCSAGDLHLIPGLGKSPGGVHDNPLQYSCRRIPWTEDPENGASVGTKMTFCFYSHTYYLHSERKQSAENIWKKSSKNSLNTGNIWFYKTTAHRQGFHFQRKPRSMSIPKRTSE